MDELPNNLLNHVTSQGPKRTSSLAAPIMLLTGHADHVLCVEFNPLGDVLASGSHDKSIFLWKTHGECENFGVLRGHKNAVVDVHWLPGDHLVSCSADRTVRIWDALAGEQIKKLTEHTDIVNACASLKEGPPLCISGSDDKTCRLWDLRSKHSIRTYSEDYQITAVEFAPGGDTVFTGGIESVIKALDLRKDDSPSLVLKGHSDTVTGMKLSPDASYLLTNSMDNTMRSWDIRPYASGDRCQNLYVGHVHSVEKNLLRCDWSPDGKRVVAGSGDWMVNIWNAETQELEYKLPGHNGSVNGVAFHPTEPIIASGSSDKQIYLGELAV